MKIYNFLAKAQTTLQVGGKIIRLSPGETFKLEGDQGQLVLEHKVPGSEHTTLIVIEESVDALAEAVSSELVSDLVTDLKNLPPDSELEPAPLSDPEVQHSEPEVSVDEVTTQKEAEDPVLDSQPVDEALPAVPLEDKAHWSTVKAFLLSIEAEAPVNLKMVEAVKQKYGQYSRVQQEADRILAAHTES